MLTWPTFLPLPFLKLLKAGIFIWPLWLLPLIHYDEPFSLITRVFDQETATYIRLWAAPSFTLLSIVFNGGKIMRPSTVAMCALVNLYLSGNALYNAWGALFPTHSFKSLMSAYRFLIRLDLHHYLLYLAWLTPPMISFTAFNYLYKSRGEWSLKIKERFQKGFRFASSSETSDAHGSARLATFKEIKALNNAQGIPIGATLPAHDSAHPRELAEILKKTKGRDIIRIKSDHALVIAPSGAGKGIGIVVPTLLDYQGPVLVTDIKGENYAITHKARLKKGKKVWVFDPFHITGAETQSFNMLEKLDPHSPSFADDAAELASILCPISGHSCENSQYFLSQAASVIQCLILYVKGSKEFKETERHLGTVFDILSDAEHLMDVLRSVQKDKDLGRSVASNLAGAIISTSEKELSSTLNTARQELRFINSSEVKKVLSHTSCDFTAILSGNVDIFLCLPPAKRMSHGNFMRLMVGLIFLEIQKAQGKMRGNKLLMVLDEMPSLGYMPFIEDAIVYGRGYGVSVLALSQTAELLRSTYPKSWKTFFSNHLSLFFGANDQETCELISSMLGKTTVKSRQESTSAQRRAFLKPESHQTSISHNESGRALLTADEIRTAGESVVFAFMRGKRPLVLERIDYRKRREWKGLWGDNPFHERG